MDHEEARRWALRTEKEKGISYSTLRKALLVENSEANVMAVPKYPLITSAQAQTSSMVSVFFGPAGSEESLRAAAFAFLEKPVKKLMVKKLMIPRAAVRAARNVRQRAGVAASAAIPITLRRRVLENAADLFHHKSLLREGVVLNVCTATQEGRKHCLKQLFGDIGHSLFLHGKELDIDDPPAEMFRRISFPDLWDQYLRLQEFAQALAAERRVQQVQRVEICFPRGDRAIVPLFAVEIAGQASVPPVGTLIGRLVRVNTRRRSAATSCGDDNWKSAEGVGRVIAEFTSIDEDSLYRAIMTSPYALIYLKSIWHIVWVYHHCAMRCVCTATMCETANSALRLLERRNSIGRPWNTQGLVEATRLRCAGIRGDLGDAALLWRALLRHFGQTDRDANLPFLLTEKWRKHGKTSYTPLVPADPETEGVARRFATELLRGMPDCQLSRRDDFERGLPAMTEWKDQFTRSTWDFMRRFVQRQPEQF